MGGLVLDTAGPEGERRPDCAAVTVHVRAVFSIQLQDVDKGKGQSEEWRPGGVHCTTLS